MAIKRINIEKVAAAIEADAGEALPGLREALAEAKAGKSAATHTPDQIEARKRGRPAGSIKADAKVSVTMRFDPEVVSALKATGPGWQTRVNDTMRKDLKLPRRRAATKHVTAT